MENLDNEVDGHSDLRGFSDQTQVDNESFSKQKEKVR